MDNVSYTTIFVVTHRLLIVCDHLSLSECLYLTLSFVLSLWLCLALNLFCSFSLSHLYLSHLSALSFLMLSRSLKLNSRNNYCIHCFTDFITGNTLWTNWQARGSCRSGQLLLGIRGESRSFQQSGWWSQLHNLHHHVGGRLWVLFLKERDRHMTDTLTRKKWTCERKEGRERYMEK